MEKFDKRSSEFREFCPGATYRRKMKSRLWFCNFWPMSQLARGGRLVRTKEEKGLSRGQVYSTTLDRDRCILQRDQKSTSIPVPILIAATMVLGRISPSQSSKDLTRHSENSSHPPKFLRSSVGPATIRSALMTGTNGFHKPANTRMIQGNVDVSRFDAAQSRSVRGVVRRAGLAQGKGSGSASAHCGRVNYGGARAGGWCLNLIDQCHECDG